MAGERPVCTYGPQDWAGQTTCRIDRVKKHARDFCEGSAARCPRSSELEALDNQARPSSVETEPKAGSRVVVVITGANPCAEAAVWHVCQQCNGWQAKGQRILGVYPAAVAQEQRRWCQLSGDRSCG